MSATLVHRDERVNIVVLGAFSKPRRKRHSRLPEHVQRSISRRSHATSRLACQTAEAPYFLACIIDTIYHKIEA